MNMKKKGEWIRDTYQVINSFPFVQGVLYYTEVASNRKAYEQEGLPLPTRFIHGLDLRYVKRGARLEKILRRDGSAFFPLQGLFVEQGVLYQVFTRLEGTLMAHHLYRSVPLSLEETLHWLKEISGHLVRLYENGQFTVVHPQNILLKGRAVRFLYGGAAGVLPKVSRMKAKESIPADPRAKMQQEQAMDVYSLGALAYIMLTGTSPAAGAVRSLRAHRPDVPEELERLVMQTLLPRPKERPRMDDLWEWLQRACQPEFQLSKKKADPVALPPSSPSPLDWFQGTFAETGSEPEETAAMDAGDWEGWQVGDVDPPKDESVREAPAWTRKANGESEILRPVWQKGTEPAPDGEEESPGVAVSRQEGVGPTPSHHGSFRLEEPVDPGAKSRKRKRLWIASAAAFLFLVGAGSAIVYSFHSASEEEAAASRVEQAAKAYAQSVQLYRGGKMEQAISKAREAVAARPQEKEYLLHLAELYRMNRDPEAGIRVLEKGLRSIPDAEVYDALAMMAYYARDWDKAQKASARAVSMKPDEAEFLYHQGKIFGAQKKYEQAAKRLEAAVAKEPENALYHHDLGVFYLRQGNIQQAKKSTVRATELDGKNAKYWLTAGVVYLSDWKTVNASKDLSTEEKRKQSAAVAKEAIRFLSRSVKLRPDSGLAYYHLSVAQYYYGDYKQAAVSADQAVRLSPKTALYHYQKGIVAYELGNEEEAAKAFQTAAKLDPDNSRYQQAAGNSP